MLIGTIKKHILSYLRTVVILNVNNNRKFMFGQSIISSNDMTPQMRKNKKPF